MNTALKFAFGQYSNKGRKAINQDFQGVRAPKNTLLNIKGVALATADGISSSDVSNIASETAVKTFLEDYYCTSEAWSVKSSVERVLGAINSWLYAQTMHGPYRYDKDKGYVCTFSTVIVKNQTAHIFHVGDTRVYRLNSDGLEQLTNDHRLWASKEKSYLSRALGVHSQCDFDYQAVRVRPSDVFIICTDGVHEFITPQDIINTIHNHSDDLHCAAKSIVELAHTQGSHDNLSIQLLRIDELPEQAVSDVKIQVDQLPFPPQLSARMEFDGYIILREIHAGSRSHVYLALDKASQRRVVLKIPSVDLCNNTDYLERFLMEEWIARRINSAHVLKDELPDRQRNYFYMVFEYIEGQTLAQWAADNPEPSIETVRGIAEQIAKGLHAFHRMDMLHQDLRPENIMIDSNGSVKIIDFGSVMVAGLQESLVIEPNTYLAGTALYSAPEYFLGDPGTTRSDLFSLGVISYFLLSGRYPYGTGVAKTKTLSAQRQLRYQSVFDEGREIPIWVDDAIRKAVHPLPDRRYEELFEFIHDLRRPGSEFLNRTRPPLIERNPVLVWQSISLILTVVIIYLLIQ